MFVFVLIIMFNDWQFYFANTSWISNNSFTLLCFMFGEIYRRQIEKKKYKGKQQQQQKQQEGKGKSRGRSMEDLLRISEMCAPRFAEIDSDLDGKDTLAKTVELMEWAVAQIAQVKITRSDFPRRLLQTLDMLLQTCSQTKQMLDEYHSKSFFKQFSSLKGRRKKLEQQYRVLKQALDSMATEIQPIVARRTIQTPSKMDGTDISPDEISTLQEIAIGTTSTVFKASYQGHIVSLKRYSTPLSSDLIDIIRRESKMQFSLRSNHIINFVGISMQNQTLSLVLEYFPSRGLDKIIRSKHGLLTWQYKVKILKEVAAGMMFLNSKQLSFANLQSKNVLVNDKNETKLSFFGASLSNQVEFTFNLIHSIQLGDIDESVSKSRGRGDQKFTREKNAFQFGLIMWEITSEQVFRDISMSEARTLLTSSPDEIIRPYLGSSYPKEWCLLMKKCLDKNPFDRPTFKSIHDKLTEIYEAGRELSDSTSGMSRTSAVSRASAASDSALSSPDPSQNSYEILDRGIEKIIDESFEESKHLIDSCLSHHREHLPALLTLRTLYIHHPHIIRYPRNRDACEEILAQIRAVSTESRMEGGNFLLQQSEASKSSRTRKALFYIFLYGQYLECVENYPTKSSECYLLAAERGCPYSQNEIGLCFSIGYGVRQNDAKAYEWFRKSAEQGDAEAKNNVGNCFYKGQGVKLNYKEAAKWYQNAGEQMHGTALMNLAVCYENGRGVERDLKKAYRYFVEAGEHGLSTAQNDVGNCLLKGLGTTADPQSAVTWFRLAAHQGNVEAQLSYGQCLETGVGIEANASEALKWFQKTCEAGHLEGQYHLARMYLLGPAELRNVTEALRILKRITNMQQMQKLTMSDTDHLNATTSSSLSTTAIGADSSDQTIYPPAFYLIGLCYEEGFGVTKDQSKALVCYHRASESNHAESQFTLSRIYESGRNGVVQDLDLSLSYLRRAAENGHGDAQSKLGSFYRDGKNVPQDTQEGLRWYRLAAAQGNSNAEYNLGFCYERGIGVEQSYDRAVEFYRASSNKGNFRGQNNLGFCFKTGRGVAQNYGEALKWFQLSAEQGYAVAQNNLGTCYYFGQGVAIDNNVAVKWFHKAAEQGNAGAQYNLGVCYAKGKGVPSDPASALSWFRKAAEQGNADAQYNLGVCYSSGNGVVKSQPEAYRWFLSAAQQGNVDAQNSLGACFEKAEGVAKDLEQAIKWYRRAAEHGHVAAQYNLGLCLTGYSGGQSDYPEAIRWFRKAASSPGNDSNAQYNLGVCYAHGRGVSQDFAEAFQWFLKAAGQGHAEAQFNVGHCYAYGRGVTRDHREAAAWFRKACEQGDVNAYFNLAVCFANGFGVEINMTESARLLRKAAQAGHAEAMGHLGLSFFKGRGVPQSFSDAVKWFQKAAERGNDIGQAYLGFCFEHGHGIPQCYPEALRYYRLAAGQGNDWAKKQLTRLGETATAFESFDFSTIPALGKMF